MDHWDFEAFNEKMGNMIEYGVVVGRALSGKSEIAKLLVQEYGYTIVDMKDIEKKLKDA